jgi:hypothetical protein
MLATQINMRQARVLELFISHQLLEEINKSLHLAEHHFEYMNVPFPLD